MGFTTEGNMILIGVPVDYTRPAEGLQSSGSSTGSLTANSAVATLPSTNLWTVDPKEKWRSTGVSTGGGSSEITLSFTRTVNNLGFYDSMVLVNHNLTSDATYHFDSSGFSGTTYKWFNGDSYTLLTGSDGVIQIQRDLIYLTSRATTNNNDAVLSISDTGNPDGYIEAGRFITGKRWSPSTEQNFDYGWTFQVRDLSRVSETPNGTVFIDEERRQRIVSVSYNALKEDEALGEFVFDLLWNKGHSRDFYLVLRPENSTKYSHLWSFYCRLATDPQLTNFYGGASPHRFRTALQFIEII